MNGINYSEFVLPGHPDKICDVIADTFVQEAMDRDPLSFCGVEVAIHVNNIFLCGKIETKEIQTFDVLKIVQKGLKKVGYDINNFKIINNLIVKPITEIERILHFLSNDQSITVGYAENSPQTNYIPTPHYVAYLISKSIFDKVIKTNDEFHTDGKVLVIIENNKVKLINISLSHKKGITRKKIINFISDIVDKVLKEIEIKTEKRFLRINMMGDFSRYGPYSDSGLTGKKTVMDFYGPSVAIGGGGLSGKSPNIVDRFGAIFARNLALDYLFSEKANKVLVYIVFLPAISKPIEATVIIDNNKTFKLTFKSYVIEKNFKKLNLSKLNFIDCAMWGHFTRPFDKIYLF